MSRRPFLVGLKTRLKAWRTLSSAVRLLAGMVVAGLGAPGPSSADTSGVDMLALPLTELCPGGHAVEGLADIGRRLVVKAWYPREGVDVPDAGRLRPLLLFNAAWGGSSDSHFGQILNLVAHGFVVISIDHRLDLDEYGQFLDFSSQELFERTRLVADHKARQFASDNSAVFDALTAAATCPATSRTLALLRSLDFSRAGILGYSFGGAVAAQTAWQDPRFKAALNLDGWLFADAAKLGVVQPLMEISDDTPMPTPEELSSPDVPDRLLAQLNDSDYRRLRANMIAHGGYYLVMTGANHESFVDVSKRSIAQQFVALLPSARGIPDIVNAYILTFFERYVAGTPTSLIDDMPSPYQQVRLEFARPPSASR
ncbi:hypothetical protein LMIY3S_01489 [Labrys miyagiensis]